MHQKRPLMQKLPISRSFSSNPLLSVLGLEFQVLPADIPEEPRPGETAGELVQRLSSAKAWRVASQMQGGFVIGADSVVVWQGLTLGKPSDAADAARMLRLLRGTRHQVTTGVTVVDAASGRALTDSMTSDISLRDLSDQEIEDSIASGTPLDKAGAYAVQDPDLRPAESWQGCYSNIVGLPVCRLAEMLEELGFPLPSDWSEAILRACGDSCPLASRRAP